MAEIKLVNMEKDEFESGDGKLFETICKNLGPYDSDSRIEIIDNHDECSHTKVRLSIENLAEENDAVVSEKLGFEMREQSKWIGTFGNSGWSRTWQMDENLKFSDEILTYKRKIKIVPSVPDRKNQASSCSAKQLEIKKYQ